MVSGFRMNRDLGADVWIGLCVLGVLFLGLCFLSGFFGVWWLCVVCLPGLFSWCINMDYLLVLAGWITQMTWRKEVWRGRYFWLLGHQTIQESENTVRSQLQSKEWDKSVWVLGEVGKVWLWIQCSFCPWRSSPWVNRECMLESGSETKKQMYGLHKGSTGYLGKGERWLQLMIYCSARDRTGGLCLSKYKVL